MTELTGYFASSLGWIQWFIPSIVAINLWVFALTRKSIKEELEKHQGLCIAGVVATLIVGLAGALRYAG